MALNYCLIFFFGKYPTPSFILLTLFGRLLASANFTRQSPNTKKDKEDMGNKICDLLLVFRF